MPSPTTERKFSFVQIFKWIQPMPAIGCFFIAGPVAVEQFHDIIYVHPDLGIAFLLAFVKDQLQAEM